jgi:hypothetical protein
LADLAQISTLAQFGAGVYIAYSLFPSLRIPHLKLDDEDTQHVLNQSEKALRRLEAQGGSKTVVEDVKDLRHKLILAATRVDAFRAFLARYDVTANIFCVCMAVACIGLLAALSIYPSQPLDPTLLTAVTGLIAVPIIVQLGFELAFITYFTSFLRRKRQELEEKLEDDLLRG